MDNLIGGLLKKFSVLVKNSEDLKLNIITTIKKESGVSILEKDLSYRDGLIKLNIKPILKTQIKLNETAILEELNKNKTNLFWKKII